MIFAHDTEGALGAAAALANSTEEPDAPVGSIDGLAAFFVAHAYTGRRDGTLVELDEVRAVRPAVREVLLAERDRAVELVNAMLERAEALPQLVRHGEGGWHLHAVAADRPLADRIVVETAMAMVDVIRSDALDRLGTCAAADCDGVVVDLSRNRSRRFCSAACGNRKAVADYRARRRAAESRSPAR